MANIGEVAAILLDNFTEYKNRSFELTGNENFNFYDDVNFINDSITAPIQFESPNLLPFYTIKKKVSMAKEFIIVMMILHILPRFQKGPRVSNFYEKFIG